MERWREVWREGLVPHLSTPGLEALRKALIADSADLIQGDTFLPDRQALAGDWPVEAACAISFCGWQGDGLRTTVQVLEFFTRVCLKCDLRLGIPPRGLGSYAFLRWFDDTPRDEMRAQLLAEVSRELAQRAEAAAEPVCR